MAINTVDPTETLATTEAITGVCEKMPAELEGAAVKYQLKLGDQLVALDQALGKSISVRNCGVIECIACGRKTKKSFSQGHCFPCMKTLARCDTCIMSPERCHFHAGTCREPEWAEKFCMTDHIVYLANTGTVKVGITRLNQIPTRWIDQGAEQALPIFRTATRQQAGFVEDCLRSQVADKTNWRKMLKEPAEKLDLAEIRDQLIATLAEPLAQLQTRFGDQAIEPLVEPVVGLEFPVAQYPSKITSHNLDKVEEVSGQLMGIKGQYLILDTGVLNLRKYTGYVLEITR
jgi:hypothetical protein